MRKAMRQAGWALAVAGGIACTTPAPAQTTVPTIVVPVAGPEMSVTDPSAAALAESQARIEQAMIELAWMADPALFTCSLSAQIDRGTLVVRGYVPNAAVRDRAVKIAQDSSNYQVLNRITIHPGLSSRMSVEKPDTVTREARAVLEETFPEDAKFMQARADARGRVTVTGSVNTFEDKLTVSRKLRRVVGCSCVDNQLSVVSQNQDRVVVSPAEPPARTVTLPVPARVAPAQPIAQPVSRPITASPTVPATLPVLSKPPASSTSSYQRIDTPSASMPEVPARPTAAPAAPPPLPAPVLAPAPTLPTLPAPTPVTPGKTISSTVVPSPSATEIKPVQILTRPTTPTPPAGSTSYQGSPGAAMSQRRAALNSTVPGSTGIQTASATARPAPVRAVVPAPASTVPQSYSSGMPATASRVTVPSASPAPSAYPAPSLTPPAVIKSSVISSASTLPPQAPTTTYQQPAAKAPSGSGAYVTTGVVTISYEDPPPPRPTVAPTPAPVGVAQPVQMGPTQIKKRIESVCGPAARQVQVFTRGGRSLQIHVVVKSEKDGQAVSDKILVLPELSPYEVDLAVDVKP